MSSSFPERLRNPRFSQGRPKRVDYSAAWQPRSRRIARGSQEEADLVAIIRSIGDGNLIPERCYRHGVDRTQDRLLDEQGIKHFHLGGADSDVILFLVEYDESVLLLEIGTHADLETEPPGSVLASLHQSCLRRADRQAVADRAQRIAAKTAAFVKGLLPRKTRD